MNLNFILYSIIFVSSLLLIFLDIDEPNQKNEENSSVPRAHAIIPTYMKDCGLFNPHDWGKWEQYVETFKNVWTNHWLGERKELGNSNEDWQKRKCNKCGKEQREKI